MCRILDFRQSDIYDRHSVTPSVLLNPSLGGNLGDVNGDGIVDVSDYIGVANLILFGTIDGR